MKLYLPWWPSGWLSPVSPEQLILKRSCASCLASINLTPVTSGPQTPISFTRQVPYRRRAPIFGTNPPQPGNGCFPTSMCDLLQISMSGWLCRFGRTPRSTLSGQLFRRTALPPYIVLVWSVYRMCGAIYSSNVSQVTWRLNVSASRPPSSLHGIVFVLNSQDWTPPLTMSPL